MKPINIFAISRTMDEEYVSRFEKQMSDRGILLHVKKWEIDGLRRLVDHLCHSGEDYGKMDFYYSFQIPKLGKEFDLLQISEEDVVNIELKSEVVPEEKIRKQLLLNKHYLASLGKNMYFFTYVSDSDSLYRLTHSERLAPADWDQLRSRLRPREECDQGAIEDLFLEEKYLISPLTDPDRFLRRDYFLTSQQRDIRLKIMNQMIREHTLFQGFTGLPGTGKTLLLYDLAMQLSMKQKVCVLHLGSFPEELHRLDQILKRIDYFQPKDLFEGEEDLNCIREKLAEYSLICVDEGHRITREQLELLQQYAVEQNCPVVFSYDSEEAVSPKERNKDISLAIESLPGYVKYRLTNRIRTNAELSNFIQCVLWLSGGRRRTRYTSVSVVYAQNPAETNIFLEDYQDREYIYLYDRTEAELSFEVMETESEMDAAKATCKEFDRVVMVIDDRFYYDEEGYLRVRTEAKGESPVRVLFHGLSRAKNRLAIVVENNQAVFGEILSVLQGN